MSANNNSTGGIGFCGLLSIVFIILKLTHFIDWSWWWVLSPLWLPLTAALSIILVILVLKAIFKS